MRLHLWLFALLALPACRCTATPPAAARRLVDVPITVDEVRQQARPPEITVEVKTVTHEWDSASDGNCGHAGIACALVLLMPRGTGRTVYQTATLREQRSLTDEATFSERGELIVARAIAPTGRVRVIEPVHATRLGRDLVVVTREGSVRSDGKATPLRRASLLAQIDLLPAYLDALVEDQRSSALKQHLTLGEMARLFSDEDRARARAAIEADARLSAALKTSAREQLAPGGAP